MRTWDEARRGSSRFERRLGVLKIVYAVAGVAAIVALILNH